MAQPSDHRPGSVRGRAAPRQHLRGEEDSPVDVRRGCALGSGVSRCHLRVSECPIQPAALTCWADAHRAATAGLEHYIVETDSVVSLAISGRFMLVNLSCQARADTNVSTRACPHCSCSCVPYLEHQSNTAMRRPNARSNRRSTCTTLARTASRVRAARP